MNTTAATIYARPGRHASAFTLVELLVVMAIIGVLAAVGLPRLSGFGKGNAIRAASGQLVQDLMLARLKAISSRSRVYVVFLPKLNPQELSRYQANTNAFRAMLNLFDGQFSAYAILTERTLGDQPGRSNPRYITEWKRLPEGVVVAPWTFSDPPTGADPREYPFDWANTLPFPLTDYYLPAGQAPELPFLIFNPLGQIWDFKDKYVTLIRGTVFVQKDANGTPVGVDVDVPKKAERIEYERTRVLIPGLTGRAVVERAEMR